MNLFKRMLKRFQNAELKKRNGFYCFCGEQGKGKKIRLELTKTNASESQK